MSTTTASHPRADWRPGTEVTLDIDDTTIRGQVWARCPQENYVWVALDGGRFVAINTRYRGVYQQPGDLEKIGRVSA